MLERMRKLITETKHGILLVTYGLLLFFVLVNLGNFWNVVSIILNLLRPLFLGLGIAYILNMPMSYFEKQIKKYTSEDSLLNRKSRSLALTITLILAVMFILLLVVVIIPQLIESLTMLFSHVGEYIGNIIGFFIKIMNSLNMDSQAIQKMMLDIENLPWDQMLNNFLEWVVSASSSLGSVASDVMNRTISLVGELGIWLTGFMASLYLLANKEKHLYQARKLTLGILGKDLSMPCFDWAHRINLTFSNFIGGQLLEACIIFALYYVSMSIMKMPYALVISTLIGITSVIPVFGAMIGSGVGFILILGINPWQAIFYYIFYQLMQQFENNVIYPRVVGNSVGLPGVWVLISILAFGSIFGVLGMFIAVPASAVIYQAISSFASFCIGKRNLELNEEGFLVDEEKSKEA